MITENGISENEENKNPELQPDAEQTPENQSDVDVQKSVKIPEEKVLSEVDPEKSAEQQEDQNKNAENPTAQQDTRTVQDLVAELEKINRLDNAGSHGKDFNTLKNLALSKMSEEKEHEKQLFTEAGNSPENFVWEHPLHKKLEELSHDFRFKHDDFLKNQEAEQAQNLEHRKSIIEKLKTLYTNTEPGTNLFKAIREIKESWKNSGQIPKSDFKLLNNDYFYHLNQFYQMLDLNKEYMEQEYAHNLETRKHIIERAKELENENVVQKALNELQYLHKLWKEEAEPVAEEFREQTWEEFKEISNRIHSRKTELSAQMEEEQLKNLETKNAIIEEIKKIAQPENANHSYWQNAIKKIEILRSDFLKTGSVPKKNSNQNWTDFKNTLRDFNAVKNEFYKGLKGSQQTNLEEKQKLILTAKEHMNSEDWETAVPLFKKLQEDWKKIGHVPRSMSNTVWEDFHEACNTFFGNFREKNAASTDNWKENYKQKKHLLEELKTITDEDGSIERIEALKTAWNNIGKVPREHININTEFNKVLREKLKLNKINDANLKEEGLSGNQLTDKARKIKSQISEMENEIVTLENNLGFFHNPSRENPLLKDTYAKIDDTKLQLEKLKQNLHQMINENNDAEI